MIAIIDYGMGNIHSVQKALESLGAEVKVTDQPEVIKKSDKIVLPGVGAFDDAVLALKKQGLAATLKEAIKNKKIFLGICLGMQILFDTSEEASLTNGLGIISGQVLKFKVEQSLKVPHMGWNQLKVKLGDCPLFKGLAVNPYVYFCHSYYAKPLDVRVTAAATDYGKEFTSVIWQDNVFGVQFHPEKSQDAGLVMLKNFVAL